MQYSDDGVTYSYEAKENAKSNYYTTYFHCGYWANKMTSM